MLTLEKCRYTPYGTKQVILNIESFVVDQGDNLVIVGPSGSGKTTLLRALSGLLPQDGKKMSNTGRLTIDGELISGKGSLKNRRLAYMSQELGLWPHLTCLEHLSFILTYGRSLKDNSGERWLDLVDLGHRYSNRPEQLSGGEQKRLALARVLSSQPRYLFLDEPFANIDLVLAEELLDIIAKQHDVANFSLVTVTHHQLGVKNDDTKIVILDKGQIVQQGCFQDIMKKPANCWTTSWTRLVK